MVFVFDGGDSRFQADIELAISLPLVAMDWWFTELNADKILKIQHLVAIWRQKH